MQNSNLDFLQKSEKAIQKMVTEIARKQTKIIDDFLKAYCASRNFKAKDIRNLRLIIKQLPYSEDGYGGYEYSFELKREENKTKH